MSTQTEPNAQEADGRPQEGQETQNAARPMQTTDTPETPQEASPAQAQGENGLEALPDWAQEEIRSLRRESADQRRKRQEQARAAQEAEEARLEAQQEFETLASQRQARIQELEPQAELAARLTELITRQINAEIQEWPEEVTSMAPQGDVSPLAMLEWVEQARPLAQRLATPEPAPGNGSRPRQAGTQRNTEQAIREAQRGLVARRF